MCKLSIAFAVCCAVICGISIAPLVVAILLALFAFVCLVICLLIYIGCAFVWLFSIGKANIFGYASSLAHFGFGLFDIVSPLANFSFHYITPIAGGIAVAVGILGIIFSSVGMSRANNQMPQDANQGNYYNAPQYPATMYGVPMVNPDAQKKGKKKKTDKGVCVATLTVSIVFSVIAVIAIIVAALVVHVFYV